MSSDEVRNAIGDPVLTNIYSSDQLVYVYSYKALWQSIKIKRLFLHFDHDRLTRWDVSTN
jgi:outer membrane protein assembly factor BamE (lipoprotein component of BamABCDE complex)